MKLLFAGNLHIEYGVEWYISKYLKKLGYDVIEVVYPTYLRDYELLNVLLDNKITETKPDLVLCAKCMGLTAEHIKEIKTKHHVKIVQWVFDNMGVVNGEDRAKWWIPQAKEFDMVFNSEFCMNKEYKKLGINHRYTPQGYDPEIFHKLNNIEKDNDVVFVGNLHNEWRKKIVTELPKHFKFIHYSNLFKNELNLALNKSKVAICTNYNDFEDRGYSNRVPEAIGSGIAIVSPELESMKSIGFVNGINYVKYQPHNIESLIESIKFLLYNEPMLNNVSNEGNKLALKKFTWDKIINEVIKEVMKC